MASVSFDDSGWARYAKITSDNTQVDEATGDLMVDLADMPSYWWNAQAVSGGGDVRITNDAGDTAYSFELENFNNNGDGTGTGILFFDCSDDLVIGSNVSWYIYTGNDGASMPAASDTLGRDNVWADKYKGVYHGSASSGYFLDSTSYNNDGRIQNNVSESSGFLGVAMDCAGGGGDRVELDMGDMSGILGDFNPLEKVSLMGWAYLTSSDSLLINIGKHDASDKQLIRDPASGGWRFGYGLNGNYTENEDTFGDNTWHHFGYVASDDSNNAEVVTFKNGSKISSSGLNESQNDLPDGVALLNRYRSDLDWNRPWDGKLDEFRVIDGVESASFYNTHYNNQSDPTSFWTVSEDNTAPDAPSNPNPSDGATGVSVDPTLSVDVSDPDGDTMDVNFYDASDDSLIGSETGVSSGGTASVEWTGLSYDTSYSWYAVADDGSVTTQSSTWSFDTKKISTYTDSEAYEPGQTVDLTTDLYDTTNFAESDILITLTDPSGTDRIANERPLEFQDYFTNATDTGNDWNLGADYSVNETDERLEFGYSGSYKQESVVTALADKSELSLATKFMVTNDAEHNSRLIARYQDDDNYVAFFASYAYSVVGIEEVSGGTRYYRETSKPFSMDTWQEIRGSIDGDEATLIFNGKEVLSKTLNYVTSSGQMGIMTDASTTYYDYFTIGHPDATVESFASGQRVTLPYTLPSDSSESGGTWDQLADLDGGGTDSNQFNGVTSEPNLENLNVSSADKWVSSTRTIECDVLESDPSDINDVNLQIWDPSGSSVLNQSITYHNETTYKREYDHDYDPPNELASEGDWEYEWTADDGTTTDTESGTFNVQVPAPELDKIQFKKDDSEVTIAQFGETISMSCNIVHPQGTSMDITVKIVDPDGTEVVNATPTEETANEYVYDYEFPTDNWKRGDYDVTFEANDGTYTTSQTNTIYLRWMDADFDFRVPLDLTDHFNDSRQELIGFTLVVDDTHISGNRLRIYDEEGTQQDYEEVARQTTDGNTEIDIRMKADVDLKYWGYYDDTGTEYTTVTLQKDSISILEKSLTTLDASDYFSSVVDGEQGVQGSTVARGTIGGGTKRVIAGKAKDEYASDMHQWESMITVVDSSDAVETKYKADYGDQSGWYAVDIADVNGDGNNELIAAGYKFEAGNTYASGHIAIYSYDGSSFTELNTLTWNPGTVRTEFFAMHLEDVDGDGEPEIIVGGMNGEGTDAASSQVRIYSVDGSNNISFVDNADTGLVGAITDNDRDRIFSLNYGSFDNGNKIISCGTTKTGETNDEGHWTLYGTIIVYDYSSGTLSREFQHYYYESNDLTEIFGMDLGDVDGDSNDNIITGGNYYEYDVQSDIAEVRVWSYDSASPAMNLDDRVEYQAEGHASVLSVKYQDSNNDFNNEITGAGFFNDGDYDKGFNVSLIWDGSALKKLNEETWDNADTRPVRDGETDAITIYENGDGVMEVFSTGRIGLTSPVSTYFRMLEVGGVTVSEGAEGKDYAPIIDVRYRTYTGMTLGRVDITVSSTGGSTYSYYKFSKYEDLSDNTNAVWQEDISESGVTINYDVDVITAGLTKSQYLNGTREQNIIADASGIVEFSTSNHSTNTLEVADPVDTDYATDITMFGATLNGESYEDGDVYFGWREKGTDTWNYTTKTNQTAGTFSDTLSGLTSGTVYEFKAMLDHDGDTYEGDTLEFTTKYGEISGVVQKGDPVENATVRIINQTDAAYLTTLSTDSAGEYEYLFNNSTDANKLYHVIVEYEDTDGKWNALSKWDIDPTNV